MQRRTEHENAGGPPHPYRPGYEVTAERLLELIAERELRPGDHLGTEQELADTLDVSRTVAREAVKILTALGRVTVRKGSGVHVAEKPGSLTAEQPWSLFLPADPEQVGMLFELRRILEVHASGFAASRAIPKHVVEIRDAALESEQAAQHDDFDAFRRADERFHRAVAAGSANMFIESTVSIVVDLKRQVLTIGLHGDRSGSLVAAAKQHMEIADAIAHGDTTAAEQAMAEHIDVTMGQFRQEIQWRMTGGTDDAA